MSKLWVFGDSFCQYNANWIKDLAGEDEVMLFGKGGTSLLYTYKMLYNSVKDISADDKVLIGLTSVDRHMFRDWNLSGMIDNKERDIAKWEKIRKAKGKDVNKYIRKDEEYAAAKGYFKYLHDHDDCGMLGNALMSHIINVVVPSLKTQRVAIVKTIGRDTDSTYNPDLNTNTLFDITFNWLVNKGKCKQGDEQCAVSYMNTDNHWIDDEGYKEYFFNEIKQQLKLIR